LQDGQLVADYAGIRPKIQAREGGREGGREGREGWFRKRKGKEGWE